MNFYADRAEVARVVDQLSRAQAQCASYEKEITRLKCLLAARPPPVPTALVVLESKPCTHACCDPSPYPPPRSSTEWARLRRIIQQLQLRSREISKYLNAKRYLLAPIRRLPPELLGMVFLFAATPDTSSHAAILRTASDAVRLAHVCSYWRTVALNVSQLWTTILLPQSGNSSLRVARLDFYASHAKSTPLTISSYDWPDSRLITKLASLSHQWRDITVVCYHFKDLDVAGKSIPLLKSLRLHAYYHEDVAHTTQIYDVFRDAPSLRRVMLSVQHGLVWAFNVILPWEQLTSLTLNPISQSTFSECLRTCPRLLYFNATFDPLAPETAQPTAECHKSLRKLVLQDPQGQNAIVMHSFPHLLSLSIEMDGLDPAFLAFLARSSRLEMLSSVNGWGFETSADALSFCSRPPVALLLATPSLRILHFQDWRSAMVTPRFDTPLVAPSLDDPLPRVEPPSQATAELDVEKCTAFDEVALLGLIKARMVRDPSFDPYGIEKARLEIENVPFDPEAELHYLNYLS